MIEAAHNPLSEEMAKIKESLEKVEVCEFYPLGMGYHSLIYRRLKHFLKVILVQREKKTRDSWYITA